MPFYKFSFLISFLFFSINMSSQGKENIFKLYDLSKDASIEVNRFFNDFLKLSEYLKDK